MQNRLYQYLHPGKKQQTNLRLKARLDAVALPDHAAFEVLSFDPFKINECVFAVGALSSPHTRSFIESLAIANTAQSGCRILNAGKDWFQKQIEHAVGLIPNLSAEEQNQLVRRCADMMHR